jgi:tRNA(His) guanylyltransferase
MSNNDIGGRMKGYENCWRIHLPKRMPIIIRVDGKAFHSYTSGCKKPVDENLVNCMDETAKHLCKNIQGSQVAYIQSDEISILVNNYKTIDSEPWFDNNLQKIASISAAMASVHFTHYSYWIFGNTKDALFDGRSFVLPKEEVNNYFIFRQQDATRNSVHMLARSLCSHKECTNLDTSELQELCFKKGVNWNDCLTSQKRGRCVVKARTVKVCTDLQTGEEISCERTAWIVDNEIPIFTQDRNYIEKFV